MAANIKLNPLHATQAPPIGGKLPGMKFPGQPVHMASRVSMSSHNYLGKMAAPESLKSGYLKGTL